METEIDYRNAKYQGLTNHKQRNGYGILIDDDLSLYASEWQANKLNNSTVIYISHGKYIYGHWCDNEPHGLNVFRMGDTVLIGTFDRGQLTGKMIIVFEKFNYIAIIEEANAQIDQHMSVEEGILGEWNVVNAGVLKSYDELLNYIQEAGLAMKPHLFSLVKFFTSMSNQRIKTVPCRASDNCYFGYEDGLGIVFNPNNGVVSIGAHLNHKLIEFGGIYEMPHFVIEGNFETGETIKYTKERPKPSIYSIFHKMHKKSLNFRNEYFDSKVKVFTNIEDLVRSKIAEIVNSNYTLTNTFTAVDLNDSLDYHPENLEEINRIYKIREEVYESNHIPMKKTTSKYTNEASGLKKSKSSVSVSRTSKSRNDDTSSPTTPKNLITNAPASPMINRTKASKITHKQSDVDKGSKQSAKANPLFEPIQSCVSGNSVDNKEISEFMLNRYPSMMQKKNSKYTHSENEEPTFHQCMNLHPVSSKEYVYEKETFQIPTFTYPMQEKEEPTEPKSPIKGPKYEDLSERRKRILNEYKQLNENINAVPRMLNQTKYKEATLSVSPTPRKAKGPADSSTKTRANVESRCPESPYRQLQAEAPLHKMQNRNEMLPLSIQTKKDIQLRNKIYEEYTQKGSYPSEQESPAHILRTINTQLNLGPHASEKISKFGEQEYITKGSSINSRKHYNEPNEGRLEDSLENRYSEYTQDKGSAGGQTNNRNPATYFNNRTVKNDEQESMTPTRRKVYKYYFD